MMADKTKMMQKNAPPKSRGLTYYESFFLTRNVQRCLTCMIWWLGSKTRVGVKRKNIFAALLWLERSKLYPIPFPRRMHGRKKLDLSLQCVVVGPWLQQWNALPSFSYRWIVFALDFESRMMHWGKHHLMRQGDALIHRDGHLQRLSTPKLYCERACCRQLRDGTHEVAYNNASGRPSVEQRIILWRECPNQLRIELSSC